MQKVLFALVVTSPYLAFFIWTAWFLMHDKLKERRTARLEILQQLRRDRL
jgi:hypothetical protein